MARIFLLRYAPTRDDNIDQLSPEGVAALESVKRQLDERGFTPTESIISWAPAAARTSELLAPGVYARPREKLRHSGTTPMQLRYAAGTLKRLCERLLETKKATLVVANDSLPAAIAFTLLINRKSQLKIGDIPFEHLGGLGKACGWLLDGKGYEYIAPQT